ncbi:MAG: hypothetical protein ACREBE_17370, partial [bacterium]
MRIPRIVLAAALFAAFAPPAAAQVGTSFTYQGRLTLDGAAANGERDLQFTLWDAATAGAPVAGPIQRTVTVSAGLFTTSLDFGNAVFAGTTRWLEIVVRQQSGDTTLAPRQALTPVPSALFAGNAAVLAGLSCGSGQVARWGASGWTCGSDAPGNGGTVTSLGAASNGGLVAAPEPITTSGTISIQDGGVTSDRIAMGAVGLAQIDNAQVQARVAGSCPPGSSIQAVSSGGSVSCAALPRAGFVVSTLDSAGDVGEHTAITIGADGLGLISYRDVTSGGLKVAHCADVACTGASVPPTFLDSASVVGHYTSITVGIDGLGVVSYWHLANGDLKVAHCADTACNGTTPAPPTVLANSGIVGQYSSIAIGADGVGLISYHDNTNGDLKLARCANVACDSTSPATPATLDGAASVGLDTSIAIGADGLGLISYYDTTND